MMKRATVRRGSRVLNVEMESRLVMMNMRLVRGMRMVMMVKLAHGHSSHHSSIHSMYTVHCIHAPCPFPGRPDPHISDESRFRSHSRTNLLVPCTRGNCCGWNYSVSISGQRVRGTRGSMALLLRGVGFLLVGAGRRLVLRLVRRRVGVGCLGGRVGVPT